MARTGRFGRLPGPGYDYSSIVGSLLAQYENARNANILSAWRDGGLFEGKKVTDGRLLAWFEARRNEYDKDDPEWDKWNQQITQFKYDIAEQKMMLQYARENIGEFAVARWYANSAGKFPKNSQAWRDAMINAARYRKAGQEKAAASRRSATSDGPSRTELYNREMREVTRTHIDPANRAIEWWGEVLKGAGITGGGSWDSANIDALAGGQQQVRDWILSEDPWARRLRDKYRKRFGKDFNFQHFLRVVGRGKDGSQLQVGIARKYKYHSAIPQLRENKAAYARYQRRAKTVKKDRWTEYLDAQADAEEALAEAETPEEREKIRQELAAELEPIRQFFQRRGEANAAYVVGETIDAATGGEVSVAGDLTAAPWGETGTDPRVKAGADNTFNVTLMQRTNNDREQIEGLADGTYIRIRNSETGEVEVVPKEAYPDISSTHYLDNILEVVPGVKIDGTKYPARSNAVYVAWQPGSMSVSDPDDPYIAHDFQPQGINEFAVAETIDGELMYRYAKPDGSLYMGPIPPFNENIEVFGYSNGKVKVSGVQVREVAPEFLAPGQINPKTGTAMSDTALSQQAQSIMGIGAGSRSQVFNVNVEQEEEAPPVTEVDRSTTPPEVTRLREELKVAEAERDEYKANREGLQSVGKNDVLPFLGSIGDLAADVEYNQEGLDRLQARVDRINNLIEGYEGNSQAVRDIISNDLQEAEARVREFYDAGAERFGDMVNGKVQPTPEFAAALAERDTLVERAQSVGIDVQVDQQDFFITGPGTTISSAVRTSIPEGAVEPPWPLVDKPPVYSPVLTQSSNPLSAVMASESQWRFLTTLSPEDARVVYDNLIVSNEWEDDAPAQARLAHSFEAIFAAGEAGETHLDWMRNYPGTSLGEAEEMSSRMSFFRERRQELDDSGVDFWDGIDQNDLRLERRRLAKGDPTVGREPMTEDQIDERYPWLAGARDPETIPQPQGPGLEDPGFTPLTADLDLRNTVPTGRTSRPIVAMDLMKDRPAAAQADVLSPSVPHAPVPDYDFTAPDPQATALPQDYNESRPSFAPAPTPSAVPSAADVVATPPAVTAVPAPVSAAPSVPLPYRAPVPMAAPQSSYPPMTGGGR
jgi:hypothetical protein